MTELRFARRDRVICALINGLLRLASRDYRMMVGGAIRYGLIAAARDAEKPSCPA